MRFQWLVCYWDNEDITFQTRIGLGDLASPWNVSSGVYVDPLWFPDVCTSYAGEAIIELLKTTTLDVIRQSPPADWAPVDWFEHPLGDDVPVEVLRRYEPDRPIDED